MYNLFVQLAMLGSLGLIVYLFARALPRISHESSSGAQPLGSFDRIISKLPLEAVDRGLHSFFEKFLRKSKIVTMKMDNYINSHLKNLREKQSSNRGEEMKKKIELMTIESNIPNVVVPGMEKKEEPKA